MKSIFYQKSNPIFIGIFLLLTICSIQMSHFESDQHAVFEISKKILNEGFQFVGMRTSTNTLNFPGVHYLVLPIVLITEDLIILQSYQLILFFISFIFLTNFLSKIGYETKIFIPLILTSPYIIYFNSFSWPPNYIPALMNIFVVLLIVYLNNSKSLFAFHSSGFILNLIFQMHPLSIVLYLSYVITLYRLGKIPKYKHWFIQFFIQLTFLSPWLYYHLYLINWDKEPDYHSFFKGQYLDYPVKIFDYFTGLSLVNQVWQNRYLDYGTNLYPNQGAYTFLVFMSGLIFFFILFLSLFKAKEVAWLDKGIRGVSPYCNECKDLKKSIKTAYQTFLLVPNVYLLFGANMEPHYFQYLSPILFLYLSDFVKEKPFLKCLLFLVIFSQIIFSISRVYFDYRRPDLGDFFWNEKFAKIISKNCRNFPIIKEINPKGVFYFSKYKTERISAHFLEIDRKTEKKCGEIYVFDENLKYYSELSYLYVESFYGEKSKINETTVLFPN